MAMLSLPTDALTAGLSDERPGAVFDDPECVSTPHLVTEHITPNGGLTRPELPHESTS
jgi:hypothetical protein